MVVRVTANLGDTPAFPSAYFTRRIRAPLRRSLLDWVATSERPSYTISIGGKTGAQYRGLLFEQKVTAAFAEMYGGGWLPQPVFRFCTTGYSSRAIPDGILVGGARSAPEILVVEIKYNFRREDLGQLEGFYLPVVRRAFPAHSVGGLIACRNILEPEGLQDFQILYDCADLSGLRVRRFTQYLLVGRGSSPLQRARAMGNRRC